MRRIHQTQQRQEYAAAIHRRLQELGSFLRCEDGSMISNWSDFVSHTSGNEPRELYIDVVERFATPGHAIDIGFGAGNETVDLLRRGWTVQAIDSSPAAVSELRKRVSAQQLSRLSIDQTTLAESVPNTNVDLIYAGFSLFFAGPDAFEPLWHRITSALKPGGWFAGNFLGPRDSWATDPTIIHHSKETLVSMLDDFAIAKISERDEDGTALSGPKHWHVWNVVAQIRLSSFEKNHTA